jgi:hypothetical protein
MGDCRRPVAVMPCGGVNGRAAGWHAGVAFQCYLARLHAEEEPFTISCTPSRMILTEAIAHRRVGEEHIWHGSSVGELEYLHDAMGAALATTSTTAHASKAHLGHVSLGSDGDVCPNFSGGFCNQSRTFLRGRSARPPSQPLRRPAAAHGSSS